MAYRAESVRMKIWPSEVTWILPSASTGDPEYVAD
jgi:hypothetical protein